MSAKSNPYAPTAPEPPGVVFYREHVAPTGLSVKEYVAKHGISPTSFTAYTTGKGKMNLDNLIKMSIASNTSVRKWASMQLEYEIALIEIGSRVKIH